MTKDLVKYDFNGSEMSVVFDEHNSVWVLAEDICKMIGLKNTSKALMGLDEHDKAQITFCNPNFSGKNGQKKRVKRWFLNEGGSYHLLSKRQGPEGERIRYWIFQEVLPEIRKTGQYRLDRESIKPGYKDITSNIFAVVHDRTLGTKATQYVANLMNKAVINMTAKECKNKYGLSPRDYVLQFDPDKLSEYDSLQHMINNLLEKGGHFLEVKKALRALRYNV